MSDLNDVILVINQLVKSR